MGIDFLLARAVRLTGLSQGAEAVPASTRVARFAGGCQRAGGATTIGWPGCCTASNAVSARNACDVANAEPGVVPAEPSSVLRLSLASSSVE